MSEIKFKTLFIVFIFLCPPLSAEDVPYILTASAKGDIESVRAIINSGGNPNTLDKDKITALMYAARKNQTNIVNLLIENGAKINEVEIGRAHV